MRLVSCWLFSAIKYQYTTRTCKTGLFLVRWDSSIPFSSSLPAPAASLLGPWCWNQKSAIKIIAAKGVKTDDRLLLHIPTLQKMTQSWYRRFELLVCSVFSDILMPLESIEFDGFGDRWNQSRRLQWSWLCTFLPLYCCNLNFMNDNKKCHRRNIAGVQNCARSPCGHNSYAAHIQALQCSNSTDIDDYVDFWFRRRRF